MLFLRPVLVALAATASVGANALHQYRQRSLVDLCANVDADLRLSGAVLGRIDLCLCVSAIPELLSTHAVLKAGVLLKGKSAVTAAVTALINDADDHKHCYYPDHAEPVCDKNPCHFHCKDGFTPYPPSYPDSCICEYPYTVCNGVCGDFPYCSSQKPKHEKPKRDARWRDATCPHGWSACGLWGGSRLDYECVDVTQDLWSCGGCGIPLLPIDPTGVDCTAIPGVHDVSCAASRCVVERCKSGFQISADKSTCVPTTRTSPNTPVFVNNGGGSFKARDT